MNRVAAMAGVRTLVERGRPCKGTAVMAAILLVLGFYFIFPIVLIMIQTFNVAASIFLGPPEWGLENWRTAFQSPGLWTALVNTFVIWGATLVISFPVAVVIAWTLARTRIPFTHNIELMFWISYMMPGIATTIAWITLLDPQTGLLNQLLVQLPFIDESPFNIYSKQGIVWAHLMNNGISLKVMLLTPAFRNMDASLEEAARVSGASTLGTMMRVTFPVLISPMVLVTALQLLRIFQSFETEQLLGVPFGFFVYSTMIFELLRVSEGLPNYGSATALASVTLLLVALIIPFQRWILHRRQYTTIQSGFRPGLTDLGKWRFLVVGLIATLITALTVLPLLALVVGSFMFRRGYFDISPIFVLDHWSKVLTDSFFLQGLQTTLLLATTGALVSPILFSILAYIMVRTQWRGRVALDLMTWGSGAIPGILTGLGLLVLFLTVPGFDRLYGTIWGLLLVVIIQGNTVGVNITKGVMVQIGQDMEDAARVAGAGWIRTYTRIWIPLLMPTLVMLAVMNFVMAAGTTSSIILIASRETVTLSILALELGGSGAQEAASIVGLILMAMTVGMALVARRFGLLVGVGHH